MLAEFVDFVDSVLPSVSPDFRDGAKNAILQFEKEGNKINYISSGLLTQLSQGDIISDIPFTYFDKDGQQKIFRAEAMIISTSCHIDRKNKLLFVPLLPLMEFRGNEKELKDNIIFDYMYIPDIAGKFVTFNIVSACDRELILKGIETKKIRRVASLNQIGYYFFIIKLSVYFMRKEDSDTLEERKLKEVV